MPDYENIGKTTLAPEVLVTIARMAALGVEGVSRMSPVAGVNRLFRRGESEGVEASIEDDVVYVDLYLVLKSEVNVRQVSRNIQQSVARAISEMIGMDVGHVNIHVEDIDYSPQGDHFQQESYSPGGPVGTGNEA